MVASKPRMVIGFLKEVLQPALCASVLGGRDVFSFKILIEERKEFMETHFVFTDYEKAVTELTDSLSQFGST